MINNECMKVKWEGLLWFQDPLLLICRLVILFRGFYFISLYYLGSCCCTCSSLKIQKKVNYSSIHQSINLHYSKILYYPFFFTSLKNQRSLKPKISSIKVNPHNLECLNQAKNMLVLRSKIEANRFRGSHCYW